MAKGELNNTVFQDPVGQGDEAVNSAYLMVKKGTQTESGRRRHLDSLPARHQRELQDVHEMSPRSKTLKLSTFVATSSKRSSRYRTSSDTVLTRIHMP